MQVGSGLVFCFYSYKRIYTNALHRERPRSFYKWAGERGYPTLKIGDIYVAFIIAVRF